MRKNGSQPSIGSVPVENLRHKDKRTNIPTEELRDFMADEEKDPKTLLYPRDPSLDPQLVWTGKDEQDREDLAVPAVPVYIQEKIHPRALIEQVRAEAQKAAPAQLDLFSDFNGIAFEDQVDFYQHEQNWTNRMILGDSLLVMASLAEKEGLKGKVQMVYLDPPYGIKFGSNWQVSTRKRDVKDGKAEDLTRQPEQVKAFRDTWKLGIHSYLAYLRDRLAVARELLTESGSVFVQIGDENVHLVRCLMDEVFGSENFCSQIVFRKTTGKGSQFLDNTYDVILWFAKSRDVLKYRPVYEPRSVQDEDNLRFCELADGSRRRMTDAEVAGEQPLPRGSRIYRPNPLTNQRPAQGSDLREFEFEGRTYTPGAGTFRTDLGGMNRLRVAQRLLPVGNYLTFVRYLDDFAYKPRNDIWDDTRSGGYGEEKVYVVQTNSKVIERCMLMATDPGDLVVDPTCGSGTTAYVAEQWGRRWITTDTSRVALALARTRLMASRFPYYLLADSEEGHRKDAEVTGQVPPLPLPKTERDVRKGFVYRRVPHVTLKSITNNPEIEGIHAEWQNRLEPLRSDLNHALGKSWEEWEIPRQPEKGWPQKVKDALDQWWELRQKRSQEIDAAIARHADTETLYDQPYEDPKRVRVTGPFTVESLSPHRVVAAEEERPVSEVEGQEDAASGSFEAMILDNLRKAGVQNTVRQERLKFDRLEPYAGEWVHAEGEYSESDGKVRRVAVCIGPEHGTVGPDLIQAAAREAVRGLGFDLLLVCGFAFDPHVSEEAKRYGKLAVLITRMNPDLAMGQDLLKTTGAGNLFMVFGEPDVTITRLADGKVQVEIRGVDVYDPTTGEIRSNSVEDIACWFVDTAYNEQSFFVRQAYFLGADEPYGKLKRALRAEIDEAAWSAIYSAKSIPFERPATGKIAVKVINHYGDEVLKVFGV